MAAASVDLSRPVNPFQSYLDPESRVDHRLLEIAVRLEHYEKCLAECPKECQPLINRVVVYGLSNATYESTASTINFCTSCTTLFKALRGKSQEMVLPIFSRSYIQTVRQVLGHQVGLSPEAKETVRSVLGKVEELEEMRRFTPAAVAEYFAYLQDAVQPLDTIEQVKSGLAKLDSGVKLYT